MKRDTGTLINSWWEPEFWSENTFCLEFFYTGGKDRKQRREGRNKTSLCLVLFLSILETNSISHSLRMMGMISLDHLLFLRAAIMTTKKQPRFCHIGYVNRFMGDFKIFWIDFRWQLATHIFGQSKHWPYPLKDPCIVKSWRHVWRTNWHPIGVVSNVIFWHTLLSSLIEMASLARLMTLLFKGQ